MKIRKFTAESTQEAIAKVKHELGSEALIINTKKVRHKGLFGYFKKPMVEVMAAIDDQAQAKTKHAPAPARDYSGRAAQPAANNDVFSQFQSQLKTSGVGVPDAPKETIGEKPIESVEKRPVVVIKNEREHTDKNNVNLEVQIENIEAMLSKVYREVSLSSKMIETEDEKLAPLSKVLRLFYNNLVRNEVEPEFSMNIIEKVGDALHSDENTRDATTALYEEVASVLGKPETINIKRDKKPTVAIFVGPTGVGKTTTLAKIAADSALNQDLDVAMITADTYRIAAVQQLKTYAEILGIPVAVAYTPGEIKYRIDEFSDKDLVLIDTAGRSHRHAAQFDELRELVEEAGADEVFLVLSSTVSLKNNREIIQHYSFLNEFKLIFTKADETPVFGAMLNARMLTGKSLSYVTVGQSVPDDIEVASIEKITRNLIGSTAE